MADSTGLRVKMADSKGFLEKKVANSSLHETPKTVFWTLLGIYEKKIGLPFELLRKKVADSAGLQKSWTPRGSKKVKLYSDSTKNREV